MTEYSDQDETDESDELFEQYSIVVDPGQELLRIDRFLMDRAPKISRSRIQNSAKADLLLVNEQPVKASYKVKPGDSINLMTPFEKREVELTPENIPLKVLYEDDQLVVINKPAGLVVHPGHGNYSGTLVNALVYHFKNLPSANDDSRPGLVHRLDKNTTGIMVIAKTEEALTHLAKQFFNRTTKRTYNALVWGEPNEAGTITGNIGRHFKNRKVMDVFPDADFGKHAVTHYKILEKFHYVSLLECRLETGRTHQIRAHFKHIGHSLFGDVEYGGDKVLKGTTFTKYKQFVQNCFNLVPRQALHAKSLGFEHPTTGKEMFFESDLPDDMVAVIEKWRAYST
jgi:23S rRNA pseudouridine1911/1915/1917 synthase|tara:strand:- start:11455 stop:12477 length:1023 start_codon:yes stop_codon:yes gene_type:complete